MAESEITNFKTETLPPIESTGESPQSPESGSSATQESKATNHTTASGSNEPENVDHQQEFYKAYPPADTGNTVPKNENPETGGAVKITRELSAL